MQALVRETEAAAANHADPIAVLVTVLRAVIQSDADPYLLSGVLLEGVATTIATRLPPERQGEMSVATVRLLRDRLHGLGAI